MTARTHITFAGFVFLLILTTAGVTLSAVNVFVTAAASILPDIDTGASAVGRILPRLTARIERRFGHRTVTHSLAGIAAASIVLLPLFLWRREVYLCFLAGWCSHPLLDTMTVHGVRLFHPFSTVKCVFPLDVNHPHSYRLRTGGRMDKILGAIFLVASLPLWYIAHEGYERFVRVAQHNIDAAVRDYNEFSKDHLVEADVRGYRMLTKEPLAGRFGVAGALDAHTLVFQGADGRLHTLGRPFQADYAAEYVVCLRGAPARSEVRMVDMSGRALAELGALPPGSYFFGDLAVAEKVSVPENIRVFAPVAGFGGSIRLTFATAADIAALNLEEVVITKGILTIRTAAGASANPAPAWGATVQFAFAADAKDSVAVVIGRGDTLRVDDIVARRLARRPVAAESADVARRIAAAEGRFAASLAALDAGSAAAWEAAQLDSAKLAGLAPLAAGGYAAPAPVEEARLAWQNKKAAAEAFGRRKEVLARNRDAGIGRLRLALEEIAFRSRSEERSALFRSPVAGVVADIRRSLRDGKEHVLVIVRRLQ